MCSLLIPSEGEKANNLEIHIHHAFYTVQPSGLFKNNDYSKLSVTLFIKLVVIKSYYFLMWKIKAKKVCLRKTHLLEETIWENRY